MIKQKAPKDMTFEEGIAYSEKVFKDGKESGCYSDGSLFTFAEFFEFLHRRLKEPAPNPFTPDQLAVMREHQRNGINFAVNNSGFSLLFYKKKPYIENNVWKPLDGFVTSIQPSISFLGAALEINEVICFADYAPLEEK